MRHHSTLLLLLLFAFQFSNAQSFKFRKYNEQDGLNNRFVYTIDQDEYGNLMIGTGEGLYEYDGFSFKELSEQQGLNDNFMTCSRKTADGTIWYGHNKGLITKLKGGKFEHFDLASFTQSKITEIFEDSKNHLWILTQNDGIIRKDDKGEWKQFIKGIEDITLYSIYIDQWQRIWLGTDMGLLKAHIGHNDEIKYDFVEEIIETKVASIIRGGEGLIVGTEDSGIFTIHLSGNGVQISELNHNGNNFRRISVNSLFEDKDKNLWICSNNNGLIELSGLVGNNYLKQIEYNDNTQLRTSSVRICNADREGTIWIGTLGDGLLKLTDNYFSISNFRPGFERPEIYSIYEKSDTIWSGGLSKIYISHSELMNVVDSLDQKNGLPEGEITSIFKSETNVLWVGTVNGSLLKLLPGSKKLIRIPMASEQQNQKVNDILGFGNKLYVATDYGIFQFTDEKLVSHISIQSGLSHNVVKSLFRGSKGKVWIATNNSQITYIEDGILHNIPAPLEDMLIQIRCITEDNDGHIWIGTDGLGVMCINGDDIKMLTKADGLYSDYCYSITCDQRNKLWIGHHGALSQVNVLNNHIEIFDPGNGFDIDFSDNAVERSSSGVVYFGINEGVLCYEPDKDTRNDVEPVIRFRNVSVNDSVQSNWQNFNLGYGEYKLVFDFAGVSLKSPTKVTYQYYLEGYDSDWCAPTNNMVQAYNKIGPGDYTFKVKCFNGDGFGGFTVLECHIFIDKPFWLKWWFIAICIILTLLLVRFIIRRRERYLREDQERLQHALDERTKEVVEQKELLEEKNKDITDSIQYARNIQKAMLPRVDSLKEYFADAFVYYKPRDIVSGDFYWVEKFNDTIVVSCADCTGHGVPGAFMSLIGSTLLKEVSSKKVVQSSKDVLTHLDSELSRMLNRQEDFAVEDGMDIVVFDYHGDTGILNIASANRPVILFHKGEWIEIKGDRQSIGGSGNKGEKDFQLYKFDIQPGDMIYMFSDGITDQFGGNDGKKLKRSGFTNWIRESSHLSMDDQRANIRKKFYEWKHEHDQLDDIIVIGIKF